MIISLLFGGDSSEHDTSIASYINVRSAVRRSSRHSLGWCYYITHDRIVHQVPNDSSATTEESLRRYPTLRLVDLPGSLANENSFAVNLIHGQMGEDGSLAGWAEINNVRGSFGSVFSDSLAMTKWAISSVVGALANVKIPRTLVLRSEAEVPSSEDASWLVGPVILKPGEMGASLLIRRASSWSREALAEHVGEILKRSRTALLQEFVEGREFSCGVLEVDSVPVALPAVEIRTPAGFFDHHSKHAGGQNVEIVPAAGDVAQRLMATSVSIFQQLGCVGWGRLDFIVDDAGDVYFLELNTVPGVTSHSLFTAMLNAASIPLEDCIELLEIADRNRSSGDRRMKYDPGL